jgi:hypothetical protein
VKRTVPAWKKAIKIGWIGSGAAVLLCLIGMVEAFSQRDIVGEIISMGQTLLLVVAVSMSYLGAKGSRRDEPFRTLFNGVLPGLCVGGVLALLVFLGSAVRLRAVFINASPGLFKILTFGFEAPTGAILLLISASRRLCRAV